MCVVSVPYLQIVSFSADESLRKDPQDKPLLQTIILDFNLDFGSLCNNRRSHNPGNAKIVLTPPSLVPTPQF